MFFPGDPEDLVEPVDAPVAESAVGVIEVIPEAARVDAAVPRGLRGIPRIAAGEGAQRGGAAPHVPIEFLGNGDGGQRFLRAGAAVVDEAADHADLTDFPGADELAAADVVR